jgi:tyrosinase
MTVRKSAFALTAQEQQRYINVINQLNSGPPTTIYGKYVGFHRDMRHVMHSSMGPIGTQRFLPWHRDFLLQMEKEMQKIDSQAFIPYWRWSVNRKLPPWITSFLPTVGVPAVPSMPGMPPTPAVTVHVTRSAHHTVGLPSVAQINSLDANTNLSYTQFTSLLEGYHNTVHGWVGGTMNDITVSPADPVFWMHHTEIDRIWAAWQANPANVNKAPVLTGNTATMDPWAETATQLQSIAALGYSYL